MIWDRREFLAQFKPQGLAFEHCVTHMAVNQKMCDMGTKACDPVHAWL